MSDTAQSQLKKGVIRLNFTDNRALYNAYMPFVDGCGIFCATDEQYELEQEVFVFLQLPQDMGKFAVSGRVVWLNPRRKEVNRIPGIGIQLLGRDAPKIRETIEKGLGKALHTGLPTNTL